MKKVLTLFATAVLTIGGVSCGGEETPTPAENEPAEGAQGEEVDEGLEELQSVVQDAATAQESYFTSNMAYADSAEELESEGLEVPEGITVEITLQGQDGYCVQASDDSGSVFRYDSSVGQPEQEEC